MRAENTAAHKPRDGLSAKPLPDQTFEEAVAAVLHSPPTPEQRAKKARREERKRQREQQSER